MMSGISFRQIASRTARAGPRSCFGTSLTEGATYGVPLSFVIRLASSTDRLASVIAIVFPFRDAIMIAARAPGLRHARALARRSVSRRAAFGRATRQGHAAHSPGPVSMVKPLSDPQSLYFSGASLTGGKVAYGTITSLILVSPTRPRKALKDSPDCRSSL